MTIMGEFDKIRHRRLVQYKKYVQKAQKTLPIFDPAMKSSHSPPPMAYIPSSAAAASTQTSDPAMNDSKKRGAFLVLEGVDRCGKTTQCSLLLKHLVSTLSLSAMAYRFPDRTTPIGKMINSYLTDSTVQMDDRSVHLLFSSNRWEASTTLAQHLANGTTVVCDRYAYSGVAFSAAKVKGSATETEKEEPMLSLDWCQGPDIGLPAPDAVIFLELSQEEAEQRGGYGGERYEKRDMQIRVKRKFRELQQLDENEKSFQGTPWYMVNAAQSVEDVQLDINNVIDKTLKDVYEGVPLRKMWSAGDFELPPTSNSK
jgi:dTMP kinase